uniref:30S ribosomal protein S15 n=1 Tax=Craspedostauros australis TaxID=1486917 RepID=A0A7R9ZK55_9STRA|mmetsp:Transcript_15198/g.42012  ORF Transcript_15198/g.42012 Transcript_15198/m.42012 type:complete len:186 (+) Transcript_15198:817-1374(+)
MQVSEIVKDSERFNPVPQTVLSVATDILDDIEGASEEEEDDYMFNEGELEEEDDETTGIEDDGEPPAWFTSQQRMDELRSTWRRSEKDTGSPEFQVAGMTERISYLTKHLQQNPKDYSTRRGLVALVNKRRRLLNYLIREDEQKYADIISSLGIRHKAPGRVESREDKYGRFNKQKSVKKHLQKK